MQLQKVNADSCKHINKISYEMPSSRDNLEKPTHKEEKIRSGSRKGFLALKNGNDRQKRLHSNVESIESHNNYDEIIKENELLNSKEYQKCVLKEEREALNTRDLE